MSNKTPETYKKCADYTEKLADRNFAKGCAAAKDGARDEANQRHAAAQSQYARAAEIRKKS